MQRKWKQACTQAQLAEESLASLSASIDEAKIMLWTEDEDRAQEMRSDDVTVMDIFDVNEADGKMRQAVVMELYSYLFLCTSAGESN